MDDTILRKRIAAIEAELERLRFQVAVKEEVLATLRSCLSGEPGSPNLFSPPSEAPATTPGTFSGSMSARAAQVLREHGGPMRAAEIAKRIEASGFSASGKTSVLALVISAMRRRKDLFAKPSRGVYSLIEHDEETI